MLRLVRLLPAQSERMGDRDLGAARRFYHRNGMLYVRIGANIREFAHPEANYIRAQAKCGIRGRRSYHA